MERGADDRGHRLGALVTGYGATVDWAGAAFYGELAERYPEAPVLLSTRDVDSWWRSYRRTVLDPLQARPDRNNPWSRAFAPLRAFVAELLATRFTPNWTNEAACRRAYVEHNEAVRETIESERLVEWRLGDGWGPICDALGAEVPADEFPHLNTTAGFRTGEFLLH